MSSSDPSGPRGLASSRAAGLVALLLAASALAGQLRAEDPDRPCVRPGAPARLTDDGLLKRDPVWLRDDGGTPIVYSVQEESVRLTLRRLDPAAGSSERLHPDARVPEFKASWAADGTSYAWLQSRGNQNLTLAVRGPGDERERHIDGKARNPAITPNGEEVLLSQPGKGGQQIIAIPFTGGETRYLTESPHFHNWPAVSPDGEKVAFACDRTGDLEIWVMGIDGSDPRAITSSPRRDVRPAWSPDGERIAFTSSRDGQREVYVMNADGTGATNVSRHAEADDWPAWHPDGHRIVWVAERSGRFDLFEVALHGAARSAAGDEPTSTDETPES